MPSDHVPHPPIERPDPSETRQVTIRLPATLLERVDAHLDELRAAVPAGLELNRTDAIKALLERGLRAA